MLLEYEAESLLADTFGHVDYKNAIKWNLTNAVLCLVFADPVTNIKLVMGWYLGQEILKLHDPCIQYYCTVCLLLYAVLTSMCTSL